MAGIFSAFKNEDGEYEKKVTILTTQAHNNIIEVHDRMPLIIEGDMERLWLKEQSNLSVLNEILKYTCGNLNFAQVS